MITLALENVTTCFNAAVDMITGNPVAMVFIGFGIVTGAIALFGSVRHA